MYEFVLFFVLVVLGTFTGRVIYKALEQWFDRRRDKVFLRFVRVTLPNAKTVEAISASHTDEQAIANIERRIRDASRTL